MKGLVLFFSVMSLDMRFGLKLNCPRYARKHDTNLDYKMSQKYSFLIQDV